MACDGGGAFCCLDLKQVVVLGSLVSEEILPVWADSVSAA
jgi:hypothetical protein